MVNPFGISHGIASSPVRNDNMLMDDKDLVKQRIDIVELVGEYVKLSKAGSNYKGLCPFHNEKSPSFFVHPEMGIYKCFGCNESGDVFSWLMKMEGMSFPEALRELAKRAGVKLKDFVPDARSLSRESVLECLSLTREFYHWLLVKHKIGKQALDYLHRRGISSEAIETFKLGWSPVDWDGLVRYLGGRKQVKLEVMVKAGLVVDRRERSGGYDRFRGRVMFPLQNARGQIVGFSGRVVPGLTPGEKKTGKYINTPETEVYHKRELLYGLEVTKQEIKKSGRAVVAEGELDVISSWQSGVKNIVAIKGSTLTDEQIRILKRYTEVLVLALDTDIAGDQAARKGIQAAQIEGLEVKTVRLDGGKDPDEVAQKDPRAWKRAVKEAKDIYQFYLDSVMERWDARTAEGKRKISADLLPLWAEIPNSIVQSHWIGELGKRLDVKEETLLMELKRVGQRPGKNYSNEGEKTIVGKPKVAGEVQREKLEQLLIGYWLEKDMRRLLVPEVSELISTSWGKKLLGELKKLVKGNEESLEISTLKEELPAELQLRIAEAMLLSELDDNRGLKINKVVNKLRELSLRHQLKEVRGEIVRWEREENEDMLLAGQQKFSKLSVQLAKVGGEKV